MSYLSERLKMRITKARVAQNKGDKKIKVGVKIVRTTHSAALQVGDKTLDKARDIQDFLQKEKLENFISSFYNSSFIKTKKKENIEIQEEFKNQVQKFMRDVLQGKDVDYDEIIKHTSRLSEKIKRKSSVDLVTIWAKEKFFAKENDPKKENNTDFWEGYAVRLKKIFEDKTRKLAVSICNNAVDSSISPRGKVLTFWKNQNIDTLFKNLDAESKLDNFLTELKRDVEPLLDASGRNNAKLASCIKDKYKDWFWNYIRSNNDVLQKWKEFETLPAADKNVHEVRQFMIEVGKYFDLYFPTKKSNRKIDRRSFDFYMNPETVKTIVRGKITNALTMFKLKANKFNLSGDDLEFGKVRDSFVIKLLNSCGFAGNNLKNIVNANTSAKPNSKIKDDALSFKILHNAIKNIKDEDIKDSFQKFFNADGCNCQNYKDLVYAIRNALAALRNNTIHGYYKGNATFLDFYEKNNEFAQSNMQSILRFSPMFKQELGDLPKILEQRVKNNVMYAYYNQAELEKIFNGFSLSSKPLAFIPGFAKIFRMGQKKQKDTSGYLEIYQAYDNPDLEENAQAHYNAMMQIYNNQFVSKFLDNKDAFYKAAQAVKEQNKKENEKDSEKAAFSEIEVVSSETPKDYLRQLQKRLFEEETAKKREHFLKEDETGKYQKFLDLLFIKGFNDFVITNKLNIEFKAQKLDEVNQAQDLAKLFGNMVQQYNPQDTSQVGFWIFCKMLDASYLNELGNQISKYEQACQDMGKTETQEYKDLESARKIILLCLQTNDKKYDNPQNDMTKAQNLLKGFVDDVNADWVQKKYFQSDGQTPVIFAALEQIQKYSALHIMRQVVQKAKAQITEKDFNDWQELKPKVADWMKCRQELHDKWVKNKTLEEKEKEEYKKVCEDINHYEWLNNKLNFVHVKRLYHLLMDILGRFAGYAAHHERIEKSLCVQEEQKTQKNKHERKLQDPNRNYIAHFNYIEYNQLPRHSILDMIAMGRKIVQKDRKLKNAVVKSLITILDRHGVIIKFKPLHLSDRTDTNACFKIKSLVTKEIVHLKNKNVSLPRYDKCYINMIEALLSLKNEKKVVQHKAKKSKNFLTEKGICK